VAQQVEPLRDSLEHPPDVLSKELPNLQPSTQATLRLSELENRMRRAEDKFTSGQRAFASGKKDEARQLFNEAIDLLLEAPGDALGRERLEKRLEEMVEAIYRIDVDGLGAAELPGRGAFEGAQRDRLLEEMTFSSDPKLDKKVQQQLTATQSQLPLDYHESVLNWINYFTSERGKNTLLAGFRRAGRYKPMIQRILNEEGVPQELIYLAQLESGFQPRAVSWAAATGMWQFIQATGAQYGLKQSPHSDDRLDPEKATRAAARHLRDLYNQFGDWYLAMAAYNCGPACVDWAVQRTGHADYWKLRELHALPRDTEAYVPVILALTIIGKNLKDYGIEQVQLDPALEYETIELSHATNLELVAVAADKSVAELRDLNPALLKPVAPAGFALHIPKGSLRQVARAIENVPAEKRAAWKLHRVERGETVASIAKKYRMADTAVAAANVSTAGEPEAGDLLVIPAVYTEPVTVRTVARYAPRRGVAPKAAAPRPGVAPKAASKAPVRTAPKAVAKAPARPAVPVRNARGRA
jgi:membrane-bound lytic murein transglycosylase D